MDDLDFRFGEVISKVANIEKDITYLDEKVDNLNKQLTVLEGNIKDLTKTITDQKSVMDDVSTIIKSLNLLKKIAVYALWVSAVVAALKSGTWQQLFDLFKK